MSPLERMAKAIASEDWGANRAGGPWTDAMWDSLIKAYREIQASDEPSFIKEMHYLHKIFAMARAALLSLAEGELPESALKCSLGISSHTKQEMHESRIDLRPLIFKTMIRAIAEGDQ